MPEIEHNSTAITIEIQRLLRQAVPLWIADRNDPRVKSLIRQVDDLAQIRMNLQGA